MTFIDYIIDFFINIDAVKIIFIILSTILFAFIFIYAKRKNLVWLGYLQIFAVILMFGLCLIGFPNTKLLITLLAVGILVVNVVLLSADIRRDIFRFTFRKTAITAKVNKAQLGRDELREAISEICRACQNLSKNDTGALILISDNISDSILESGTSIDAKLSSELLETIFFPKSPLHDGAVVINGDRVVSAGCYLPLTSKLDLSKELGTRHRAAIGISESNPTLTAIVVSEETGIISAMHDGKMKRYLSNDDLKQVLEVAFYLTDLEAERELWGGRAE